MTTYRTASYSDADALARLRWAMFFEEHPDEPRENEAGFVVEFRAFFEWSARLGRWVVWVAEDESGLVANLWVHVVQKVPRPNRETRPWGYLTNVYAVPGVRNTGVGSELLRHVKEWAATERLELLLVWPSDRSVPYYERAGFGPAGALSCEVAGYED